MSNHNALGPAPPDTPDWNNAWEVVRRLAAARRNALHEMKRSDPSARFAVAELDTARAPTLSEPTMSHTVTADSGQYARAIAEIQQASAALRRAEPALEEWLPGAATPSETRHPRSVWILVGGIWVSTVLVMASAIGATLLLLG